MNSIPDDQQILDFCFNDEQISVLKQAIQLFESQGKGLIGLAQGFNFWASNLARKQENLRPLLREDVKKLFALIDGGAKQLSRYDFRSAVLLLDFMSHRISATAERFEGVMDSLSIHDDEYKEIEFIGYRRLYRRLNRELPDTMFLDPKSKRIRSKEGL